MLTVKKILTLICVAVLGIFLYKSPTVFEFSKEDTARIASYVSGQVKDYFGVSTVNEGGLKQR